MTDATDTPKTERPPFTGYDIQTIRTAATAHLRCTACLKIGWSRTLGSTHGGTCAGTFEVSDDPVWKQVDTSLGSFAVLATTDPRTIEVFPIDAVTFGTLEGRPSPGTGTRIRRERTSEAAELEELDRLHGQIHRLCVANTELGMLLVCITLALSDLKGSLAGVDLDLVRDYLTEKGWRPYTRHPSGLGTFWTLDGGGEHDVGNKRLVLVDAEAGDAPARLWDTITMLGQVEDRPPTVILAYLMARQEERDRRRRWDAEATPPEASDPPR